jgi:hypothetical protein
VFVGGGPLDGSRWLDAPEDVFLLGRRFCTPGGELLVSMYEADGARFRWRGDLPADGWLGVIHLPPFED